MNQPTHYMRFVKNSLTSEVGLRCLEPQTVCMRSNPVDALLGINGQVSESAVRGEESYYFESPLCIRFRRCGIPLATHRILAGRSPQRHVHMLEG